MISTIRTEHRPKSRLLAGIGALTVLTLLPSFPAAAASAPAHDASPQSAGQASPRVVTAAERRTAAYLGSLRNRPARLKAFFRDLPKGVTSTTTCRARPRPST